MHLETYLYMLLQSDHVLPPPGPCPNFQSLALESRANAVGESWITVPSRSVTIGQHDDSKFWTWDNEKPARKREVASFNVRTLPITNGDFINYLIDTGKTKVPMSWTISSDQQSLPDLSLLDGYASPSFADFVKGKAIRTVYGPVPLLHALDWPAMGSYDELAACACHLGGRIPSLEESNSIRALAGEIQSSSLKAGLNSEPDLFVDLTDANVGFKHFHPTPVISGKHSVPGVATMGGAWEWTSTVLEKWAGFKPMPEYPAYTGIRLNTIMNRG